MSENKSKNITQIAFYCFIFLAGCAAGTAISSAFAPAPEIKELQTETLDKDAYRRICADLGFVTQMSYTKLTKGMALDSLNLPEFYKGDQFTTEKEAEETEKVSLSNFTKPYLMVTVEAPGCGFCLDNRKAIREAAASGADMDIVVLDIASAEENEARMRRDIFLEMCKSKGKQESDFDIPSNVAELVMLGVQTDYVGRQMSLGGTPATFIFGPDRTLLYRYEGPLSERILPDGESVTGNAEEYDEFWKVIETAGGKKPPEEGTK